MADEKNTNAIAFKKKTVDGAGAIDLDFVVHEIQTTGAIALTLADGADGQLMILTMTVDGGAATLTPSNLVNGSTLTFDDVGDSALLTMCESGWIALPVGATLA